MPGETREDAIPPRRRRRFVDKIALVMIVAVFMPLLVADVLFFHQLKVIRSQVNSTVKTFGEEPRSDLDAMLKEDLKHYLTETARQGGRSANEFFKDAVETVKTVSGLMTAIYSNPQNYLSRSVSEPQPDRRDLSVQLIVPSGEKPGPEVFSEIGLAANIQDILHQVKTEYSGISVVSVASENGFSIEADSYAFMKFSENEYSGYDARQRPWYISAKEKNGLCFSDVFQNYYSKKNAISVSLPFYDKGVVAGVTAISYSLDEIDRQVEELQLVEDGFAFIADRRGRVIASPRMDGEVASYWDGNQSDPVQPLNRDLAALFARMSSGGQGVGRAAIDGREYFLAFEPLALIDWSFAVAVPVSVALRPSQAIIGMLTGLKARTQNYLRDEWKKMLLALSVLHVLLACISLVAARVLSRRLTRPLGDLSDWANVLSQGNLEQPIALRTGDEIEELANTFNHMRISLSSHMEQLADTRAARERLLAELDVAKNMQQSLLPHLPEGGYPGYDLAASMTPAKLVGGDFYDFFLLDDDRLAVVMGDISDKGIPAALYMAMIKTMIKMQSQSEMSPARILAQVNNAFCKDNEAFMFASVFMGVVSLASGDFVYANAGHCDPMWATGQEGFRMLEVPPCLVLGIEPGEVYEERRGLLEPGGILLLYTDGVTEAMDRNNELYSEERLLAFVNGAFRRTRPAAEIIDTVKSEVFRFSEGTEQADDLTLLALRRL